MGVMGSNPRMSMKDNQVLKEINERMSQAVAQYWATRFLQQKKQQQSGRLDQGLRSAVTGGAQMDGFTKLFVDLIKDAGLQMEFAHLKRNIELPGYFRPTKEWDLIVVKNGTLIAAIEAKSQVGPSFGNNFNNRTEEALGSSLDHWTAYREGAFLSSPQPFLGYFFMIEDCPACNRSVRVKEPHFKVFPEFVDASYIKRYELFCRKLVLERHYTSASFITSDRVNGLKGVYKIPAPDLSPEIFAKSLVAHVYKFL
jgi:hypothetical protein